MADLNTSINRIIESLNELDKEKRKDLSRRVAEKTENLQGNTETQGALIIEVVLEEIRVTEESTRPAATTPVARLNWKAED